MQPISIRQTYARLFKKCERKFYFTTIEQLVPREVRPALRIGTACHAGRASYLAKRDVAAAVLAAITALDDEYAKIPPLTHDDLRCWSRRKPCYDCSKVIVVDVISSYAASFEKRFGSCLKILGLEVPFELILAEWEGYQLIITGTIDAHVVVNDMHVFNFEYKTTSAPLNEYFEREYLSEQHTTYCFALQQLTGRLPHGTLLDVSRKPTKNLSAVHDHIIIPVVQEDMNEFHRDSIELLKRLAYAANANYYPPNFDSCFGPYGLCEFLPICKSRFDRRTIESLYVRKGGNPNAVCNTDFTIQ